MPSEFLIGRSRIAALPSITAAPAGGAGSRERTHRGAGIADEEFDALVGELPLQPATLTDAGLLVGGALHAERLERASMYCVSSLNRQPVSVLSPSASAATSSARLVRLLLPGTVTTASTGPRG